MREQVAQAHALTRGSRTNHGTSPGGREGTGQAGTHSLYEFRHKEDQDDIANDFRRQRGPGTESYASVWPRRKRRRLTGRRSTGNFSLTATRRFTSTTTTSTSTTQSLARLFLKICSYAPWAIKLCLNGHEWANRQLEKRKIRYQALDNRFLSCTEPEQLQVSDPLGPKHIERLFRKWPQRVPLPLRAQDRQAGYDWDLSIWQMEVSLTQIFDRPVRP